MESTVAPLIETVHHPRGIGNFLTEQLSVVLEQRVVRVAVVLSLMILASTFSLVPHAPGVEADWMFIIPVGVAAIAAGIKEGLITAFFAAVLCALFAGFSGDAGQALMFSVLTARLALYGITGVVLGSFAEAHQQVQSRLRKLATLDPLTEVSNVASFYREMGMLEAQPDEFAVLLVDVDDLKSLNDNYGHQAGSAAIQLVANTLRHVVRGSDCVARYGGDEFVVILREADRAGAQIVVNRVRELLLENPLPDAPGAKLSVSAGVALYPQEGRLSAELLAQADAAMYDDKRSRKIASGQPASHSIAR